MYSLCVQNPPFNCVVVYYATESAQLLSLGIKMPYCSDYYYTPGIVFLTGLIPTLIIILYSNTYAMHDIFDKEDLEASPM